MVTARAANILSISLRKDVLTALLASGLAAVGVVVLLLLARRMAGALVQPLGGFSLVGVAGLGLLLALSWRLGWQARGRPETSLALIAPVFPGLSLFILLSVLSLPGTANWALMLTWLAFLTGEAAWWWTAYSSQRERGARRTVLPAANVVAEHSAADVVDSEESSLRKDVFQQITRSREGVQERVAVLLRVTFTAGQRTVVAHVAFCPPLCGVPELAAEVAEGPDAAVTITNPQTFGARLEVRLEEPSKEACEVLVELAGRATCTMQNT